MISTEYQEFSAKHQNTVGPTKDNQAHDKLSKIDLFVSYSRKDKEFVNKLVETLTAANYKPWLDQRDIQPTEEWLKAIYSGIDAANNFVFIITPDSVISTICKQELDHAAKRNKRLVPIVRRDVNDADVPREIASLNYIFLREGDDFHAGIKDLIKALDTDLDFVRMHTRLLVRTIEWDSSGRNRSFMLRGSDLKAAEQWLIKGAEINEPKTSQLQTEYIFASRKAEITRQRILLISVGVALIITIGLSLLYFSQRNKARFQAKIALARQLTAQAELTRTQASILLERSVLLALEAMRRYPSAESSQTLQYGLALLPQRIAAINHQKSIGSVAFSAEGNRIATSSEDGRATIWSTDHGERIVDLKHSGPVTHVSFSADGRYLATANNNYAFVWSAVSPQLVRSIKHDSKVHIVHFSRDGKYLFTVSGNDRAFPRTYVFRAWDTHTGDEAAGLRQDGIKDNTGPPIVAFSPEGRYFATLSDDGLIRICEVANAENIITIRENGALALAFSPDGNYLATTSSSMRTASIWSVASGKEVTKFSLDDYPNAIAFSPDGKKLATGSGDDIRVWEIANRREISRVRHESVINFTVFTSDGSKLVTGSQDKTVRVWDVSRGNEIIRIVGTKPVGGVAVSSQGQYVATVSSEESGSNSLARAHTVRLWQVSQGGITAQIEDYINNVAFSPDGNYLATSNPGNYTAKVWKLGRESTVPAAEYLGSGESVLFSPNGKYLAVSSNTSTSNGNIYSTIVRVWNVSDTRKVTNASHQVLCGNEKEREGGNFCGISIKTIAFTHDSKYFVTGGSNNSAIIWETESGKEERRFPHDSEVLAVVFSSDGTKLITASKRGVGRIWDRSRGEVIATMDVGNEFDAASFNVDGRYMAAVIKKKSIRIFDLGDHKKIAQINADFDIWAMAMSPSGKYVATITHDASGSAAAARIWEAATAREIARKTWLGGLGGVAFSQDEKYLATGGGLTRVWLWREDDLISEACKRLTRNLTKEEWSNFIADEPYRKTCEHLPDGT